MIMKFAIEYRETYTDSYFVEADSYEEACEKIQDAINSQHSWRTDTYDGNVYRNALPCAYRLLRRASFNTHFQHYSISLSTSKRAFN